MCAAIQIASATFFVRSFETPNSSTYIAERLVSEGAYVSPAYPPPVGFDAATSPRRPLRAYHLPGEPLYLAAGFLILPKALWPYLHVAVTLLLVLSIATVGFVTGGRALGVGAGMLASFDPFVMAHGPVWDDTFLAASLEWFVFAVTITALARSGGRAVTRRQLGVLVAVGLCAGWAAVTRTQSQFVLAGLVLTVVGSRQLRAVRSVGLAVVVGGLVALTAWGVRNAIALGTFYIGSTHDGGTLYESTDPEVRDRILATGSVDGAFPGVLDQRMPPSSSELDIASAYRRAAVAYIMSHPADVVLTVFLKMAVSVTAVDPSKPLSSARNVAAVASSALLLMLGPYGLWLLASGPYTVNKDQIAERGARLARRDDREYREYLSEEQRSQPGCPAREVVLDQRVRATREGRPIDQLLGRFCVVMTLATAIMLTVGPNGARYRIGATGLLYLGTAFVLVRAKNPVRESAQFTLSGACQRANVDPV